MQGGYLLSRVHLHYKLQHLIKRALHTIKCVKSKQVFLLEPFFQCLNFGVNDINPTALAVPVESLVICVLGSTLTDELTCLRALRRF